jgi:RecA-family ATPase
MDAELIARIEAGGKFSKEQEAAIAAFNLERKAEQAKKQAEMISRLGGPLLRLDTIDPATIPPLRWTIKNLLLQGELTLLGGVGGVGKSLFCWNVSAAVAAGEAFAWFEKPEKPRPVIIVSGEDDMNEVARRVAAYCNGVGLDYREVARNLHIFPLRNIRLADKAEGRTPLAEFIRSQITELDAGLLCIDPLIKTGAGFDENSNSDMEMLFDTLRWLVDGTSCAGLCCDHFSKGGSGDSQHALRGASSKVNASRTTATLTHLTDVEMKQLKRDGTTAEKWRLVKFAVVKQNYGDRGAAHIFLLEIFEAGAERRPAYITFDPDDLLDPEHWEHADAFLELVRSGDWSTAASGKAEGRLDAEMCKNFKMNLKTARQWIEAFAADGKIKREEIKDKHRNTREVWKVS